MEKNDFILKIDRLEKRFHLGDQRSVKAVAQVSFEIKRGEFFGLVGESGSGKTTVGNCIADLLKPDSGKICFYGQERQMIFQDAAGSLNPRMTIGQLIEEPFIIQGKLKRQQRREKVLKLLEQVGLQQDLFDRYPSDFSGGQQQRIAIARALALDPDFLIADEPVSALDLSVQTGILDLLLKLKTEKGISCLFISHDLGVIRSICDRIAVMYQGKIVETGQTEKIFSHPQHAYTKQLLSAMLSPKVNIPKNKKFIFCTNSEKNF